MVALAGNILIALSLQTGVVELLRHIPWPRNKAGTARQEAFGAKDVTHNVISISWERFPAILAKHPGDGFPSRIQNSLSG